MTSFDWSRQFEQVGDGEIPYDITFNVYEEGTFIGSIKAHKVVLAINSPVFEKQFFTCDTQDKNASEMDIYDTTYSAFHIMIADIYNKHSLIEWLNVAKVEQVFDVLKLLKRYMMDDQVAVAEKSLATFSLSYANLVDSATIAKHYFSTTMEAEAKQLYSQCVKKLKCFISGPNGGSLAAKFLEDHADNMEAAGKLLIHSKDINCPNCRARYIPKQGCLHGEMVYESFRDGLGVTFTFEEMNICSFMVTKDCGENNMKLGGANNHTEEENLYLKDFPDANANSIDGGRLYYNCKPGEYIPTL